MSLSIPRNEESLNKNRRRNLDIARGIAIICIILGHLGNSSINRVVFTFHVPIFYLIAGYFFNEKLGFVDLLKKKARTLLVPYYVTCLVIMLASIVQRLIQHKSVVKRLKELLYATAYAAGDKYTEPFYIASIGAIWFLWAMFWAECFLYLTLKLKPELRIFLVAAIFTVGYYSRRLFWFPLSIQAGCCALLFLYVGYLIKSAEEPYKNSSKETKVFIAVAAAIVWAAFMRDFVSFWLVHSDIGRGMIDVFGSLCGCWCVVLISTFIDKKVSLVSTFLSFLGRYSLLMLCAHKFELSIFKWKAIKEFLGAHGFLGTKQLLAVIAIKLIWSISVTYLLSRSEKVCRLMGVKK